MRLLLLLMSFSLQAHPLDELVDIFDELQYDTVEQCQEIIDTNPVAVPESPQCQYLAEKGARVIEVIALSMAAEGIPVHKDNRRELITPAILEVGLFDATVVIADAMDVSDASVYIGKNHPEMVEKYIRPEMVDTLTKAGLL
jgi:hypothetical protein